MSSKETAQQETAQQDSSSQEGEAAKQGSIRALSALNFFLADVQNGMGPYVTVFLKSSIHWNAAQIGVALAAGNIAQVLAQTPAGGMVDQLRQKRQLIVIGSVMVLLGCLGTVLKTVLPVVLLGQVLIGVAGAIFPLCIAAITLGLVGRKGMSQQTGRNQSCNAAGNCFAAVVIGLIGYFLGLHWMFYLIVGLCAAAIFCALRIEDDQIDYDLARGADSEDEDSKSRQKAESQKAENKDQVGIWNTVKEQFTGLCQLLRDRLILVFMVSAVLFHFANAAMVPLVTEILAEGQGGKRAILYTSGYMVASQIVFIGVAAAAGKLADKIGRKPLFLFGFAALALRGVLYTLGHSPAYLIAVQCMDGLGAGIFGVVAVLIIADLTKGTGRFNLAQGAIATAQGLGAFLSNSVGGMVARHAGHNIAFLGLAGVAAAGLVFFWVLMPETRDYQPGDASSPEPTATSSR